MATEDTTAGRRSQPTTNERQRTGKRPTTPQLVAPSAHDAQVPAAPAPQAVKLRAAPYQPHQRPVARSPQAQRHELRRFVYGGPMGWFHTVAHRIDMLVRPTFSLITQLVNLLLRWIWYVLQRAGGTTDARSTLRRVAAPELRPGSPTATLVCVLVVLFVVGSLAGPIVLPPQPEPRAFSLGGQNPSNTLKATNPWQRAVDAF
ncbi:MAG: hypothetical protein H7Y32_08885, partial [Chloroflexales bacterium]|nr:hypothetical protein [Chloroflexales bacterium]